MDSPKPTTPAMGCFLKGCGAALALATVLALALLWFYGVDSHHSSRGSIWPPRARNLTPPTAADITLHRDFLTHWATYTVPAADLEEFLRGLDSYVQGTSVDPEDVGTAIGRFEWPVTEGVVRYHLVTSNGASQVVFHDPATGRTYQVAEYW